MKPYDRYLDMTYSGKQLMKKYNLSDHGLWQIKGEDPNCDWGGAHHQPDLGHYAGTLEECIKYAVNLPNFWSWGGGGSISAAENIQTAGNHEEVSTFLKQGIREKALAKLTDEEKQVLGLKDNVNLK